MGEKSVRSQGSGGSLVVVKVFAIWVWLCLVFGGLAEAEGFASGGLNRPFLGTAILVVAAVIFIWTMRRWAKIFPPVCAFGAFGAMMAFFSGHTWDARVHMSHAQAAVAMVSFVGAAYFTRRFKAKDFAPRLPDRLATFAFVSGIFWQAVDTRMTNLALSIGFLALFAAWLIDRLKHRRGRVHHNASGTADAA